MRKDGTRNGSLLIPFYGWRKKVRVFQLASSVVGAHVPLWSQGNVLCPGWVSILIPPEEPGGDRRSSRGSALISPRLRAPLIASFPHCFCYGKEGPALYTEIFWAELSTEKIPIPPINPPRFLRETRLKT